jgi:hypothetical protein
MNTRLLRKVEQLENCIKSMSVSGPRDTIVGAALGRVCTADLFHLIDAGESQRPYQDWSDEQISAGDSLRNAMERTCLEAGFSSVAEFERHCPVTEPALEFKWVGRTYRR